MGLRGGGSRARKRKRSQYKHLRSMDAIKRTAKKCGSHWFDKDTMRFFGTRVSNKVFPDKSGRCTFFVTSEQYGPGHARRYSVRKACSCKISTVGEFQGHSTLKRAQAAAQKAANRS